MSNYRLAFFALVIFAAPLLAEERANWPKFRGPSAGVTDVKGLPTEWDTTKNVAWSVEVPGKGWSSPIVWGERIFLTSVIREGGYEDAKKGLYFGGERIKAPDVEQRWMVYCLDVKSGSALWEHEAARGKPATGVHIKNSYASETPVTDGERVYAYFGNQGLFCYDLDGKPLWSKKWEQVPTRFSWGTAASPVLYKDRLFIVNDNEKRSFMVCLNAKTGEQIWEIERDEKSNWATPFVWENEKRTELVVPGSNRVRSYDLDGKVLWELRGMSSITIPTPFTRHGLLFLGSGYVMDKKKPLFAIKPGARGDITLKTDETSNEFIAWSANVAPYNPTPLVYGDLLYVVYDMGFLSCFDAKTGKLHYEKQRIPGQYTVSPWANDGKVYFLNEDGLTTVIEAGPEYKVVAKNDLKEMCMASPAVAGHALLIRTLTKLYKIESPAN
jgi:outer membrane protein assembly factor BamB